MLEKTSAKSSVYYIDSNQHPNYLKQVCLNPCEIPVDRMASDVRWQIFQHREAQFHVLMENISYF